MERIHRCWSAPRVQSSCAQYSCTWTLQSPHGQSETNCLIPTGSQSATYRDMAPKKMSPNDARRVPETGGDTATTPADAQAKVQLMDFTSRRSPVLGTRGMVASSQPLASEVSLVRMEGMLLSSTARRRLLIGLLEYGLSVGMLCKSDATLITIDILFMAAYCNQLICYTGSCLKPC